jgi:2-methylisocitrate lyase-like PEP mutase family enzyme
MSRQRPLTELRALADRLRGLHHAATPLILPNAWDVASARAVERAGAAAVATTSSGVAESLGFPDGEAIPADDMFATVARIATGVSVPVTADVEAGYGLGADDLVARLLAAGAVGLNLEDTDRAGGTAQLTEVATAADKIAGVRAAADRAGVAVVINARIDSFLRGSGGPDERLDDALARGRAYVEAGADCVYPIWLTDRDGIGRFVRELGAPLNVLLRAGAPDVAELADLGVRRISVGGGLAHRALAHAEELARRLVVGEGSAFLSGAEG